MTPQPQRLTRKTSADGNLPASQVSSVLDAFPGHRHTEKPLIRGKPDTVPVELSEKSDDLPTIQALHTGVLRNLAHAVPGPRV